MSQIRQEPLEETGGPVFQPDTLLPSQFFTGLRQRVFVEGEKRLMAAVLADAVEVYMKQAFNPDARARQLFLDAETWIFSNEPTPWLFSFSNISDVLGLEPEYIRRGLLEWRRKRVPTIRASETFRRAPCASRSAPPRQELKKAVG
ncbi:MAG TPA: hypothetical protein VLF14_01565 [Candidatus Binatia bacterium]|nr:hypothetical protein [Candidatus Binatia bacterium]